MLPIESPWRCSQGGHSRPPFCLYEPKAPPSLHQAQAQAMSQRSRQLPGWTLYDTQRGKLQLHVRNGLSQL